MTISQDDWSDLSLCRLIRAVIVGVGVTLIIVSPYGEDRGGPGAGVTIMIPVIF